MSTTKGRQQPGPAPLITGSSPDSRGIVQDVSATGSARPFTIAASQENMKRSSDSSEGSFSKYQSMMFPPSAVSNEHHEHGDVRTLPQAWIDSLEEGKDDVLSPPTRWHLPQPSQIRSTQHRYTPPKLVRRVSQDGFVDTDDDSQITTRAKASERGFFGTKEPERGRKWDHCRQDDPVIMQSGAQRTSHWIEFVKSSTYGPTRNEVANVVNNEILDSQSPGLNMPWRGNVSNEDHEKPLALLRSKKQRKSWYQRIQNILLLHPLVPLAFRLTVFATSIIALGLAGSIYYLTRLTSFSQNSSTIMTIVVDVVAVPYIGYVTWDEYTGKPLGLRSLKIKMNLVLLDLIFIIFESANLALAFAERSQPRGPCANDESSPDQGICRRVETLCGFLLVALAAWSLTFSVSIFRVVERVEGREG